MKIRIRRNRRSDPRNTVGIRPLAFFCGVFLFCALLCVSLPRAASVGVCLAAAVLFSVCLIRSFRSSTASLLLVVCSAALLGTVFGFFRAELYARAASALEESFGGTAAEMTAVVEEKVYAGDYRSLYRVRIRGIGGTDAGKGKAAEAEFGSRCALEEGDLFSAVVTAEKYFDASDPGSDASAVSEKWYAYSGDTLLHLTVSDATCRYLGREGGIAAFFSGLRGRTVTRISSVYGKSGSAGLIAALLTGERDGLPPTVTRDFRLLGISHALALSGFHLSVLASAVYFLLKLFGAGKNASAAAASVFVLLFCFFTGFPPSVVRAAGMFLIAAAGTLLRKKSDPATSLLFASSVITAVDPGTLTDVGFLLSVSATLGIVTLGLWVKGRIDEATENRPVFFSALVSEFSLPVILTFSASLFTLPVIFFTYSSVSLVSAAANLLIVPLIGGVMISAIPSLLLASVPAVGPALAFLTDALGSALLGAASSAAAGSAGSVVSLDRAFVPWIFALTAAAVLLIFLFARRPLPAVISAAAVFPVLFSLCAVISSFRSVGPELVYTGSGTNDMITVISDRKAAVIDVSDGSARAALDAAERAQLLSGSGAIDSWVLTHFHPKNAAALSAVLGDYFVRRLYVPDDLGETESAALEAVAAEAGCGVYRYRPYEPAAIGEVCVLMSPERDTIERSAHPVIAFELSVGERKILYGGGSAPGRGFFADRLPYADTVIIGKHSPVTKEEYSLADGKKAETVIFGSAADQKYCVSFPPTAQRPIDDGENGTAEFRIGLTGHGVRMQNG